MGCQLNSEQIWSAFRGPIGLEMLRLPAGHAGPEAALLNGEALTARQDIVHELKNKEVSLRAAEQPVDTGTAAGKAFWTC